MDKPGYDKCIEDLLTPYKGTFKKIGEQSSSSSSSSEPSVVEIHDKFEIVEIDNEEYSKEAQGEDKKASYLQSSAVENVEQVVSCPATVVSSVDENPSFDPEIPDKKYLKYTRYHRPRPELEGVMIMVDKFAWIASLALSIIFAIIPLVYNFVIGLDLSNWSVMSVTFPVGAKATHIIHMIFMALYPLLFHLSTPGYTFLYKYCCFILIPLASLCEAISCFFYLSAITQIVFQSFELVFLVIFAAYSLTNTRYNFHPNNPLKWISTELLLSGLTVSFVSIGARMQPLGSILFEGVSVEYLGERACTEFFLFSAGCFAMSTNSLFANIFYIIFVVIIDTSYSYNGAFSGLFGFFGIVQSIALHVKSLHHIVQKSTKIIDTRFARQSGTFGMILSCAFLAIPLLLFTVDGSEEGNRGKWWAIFPIGATALLVFVGALISSLYWYLFILIPILMALMFYVTYLFATQHFATMIAMIILYETSIWFWSSFKITFPVSMYAMVLIAPILASLPVGADRDSSVSFLFLQYYNIICSILAYVVSAYFASDYDEVIFWLIPFVVLGPGFLIIVVVGVVFYLLVTFCDLSLDCIARMKAADAMPSTVGVGDTFEVLGRKFVRTA